MFQITDAEHKTVQSSATRTLLPLTVENCRISRATIRCGTSFLMWCVVDVVELERPSSALSALAQRAAQVRYLRAQSNHGDVTYGFNPLRSSVSTTTK